jgi:hypothetical protein
VRRPETRKTAKCGVERACVDDSLHGELQGDAAEPVVHFDLLLEVLNDGNHGDRS